MQTAKEFWDCVGLVGENCCWIWLKCQSSSGYGRCRFQNNYIDAHRCAWILTNGVIPPGLFVCHKCDVRRCCNPDHLFLGTNADNIRDAGEKGRLAKPGAKLTIKEVRAIRERLGKEPQSEIAKRYNVDPSTISKINTGKQWHEV